jgi:uncharacterized protein (DUF58 family)
VPTPLEPVDQDTLRRLHAVALRCRGGRRPDPGRARAHRLPPQSAVQAEIEDFRPYRPGDDLRFADWPSFARLGQLLIRRYREERSSHLHILLDCSRSMAVPAGDRKFAFAQNVAWLLAYLALHNETSVRLVPCAGRPAALGESPVMRPGRMGLVTAREFLSGLDPGGSTDLDLAVRRYLGRRDAHRGLVVLVSDLLLPPQRLDEALRALVGAGHEVAAIHVRGARECRVPGRAGVYRIRDAETGEERLAWLSRREARGRLAAAARLDESIDRILGRQRVRSVRADPAQAPGAFLLQALPRLDIVR